MIHVRIEGQDDEQVLERARKVFDIWSDLLYEMGSELDHPDEYGPNSDMVEEWISRCRGIDGVVIEFAQKV